MPMLLPKKSFKNSIIKIYKYLFPSIMWLSVALFFSALPTTYAKTQITEDQIKAVYMFNFANFIDWPESAFDSAESPITYCSTGNTKISENLNAVIQNETIRNRPLKHISINPGSSIESCHILFFPDSHPQDSLELIAEKELPYTLTVGDSNKFIAAGGMVGLIRENSKISLIINLKAIKRANFKMSSKLLRIAKIWKGQSQKQ